MEDAGYVDRDGVVLRWAQDRSGIPMLVLGSEPTTTSSSGPRI
jgi:hypothetical protein